MVCAVRIDVGYLVQSTELGPRPQPALESLDRRTFGDRPRLLSKMIHGPPPSDSKRQSQFLFHRFSLIPEQYDSEP